MMAPAHMAPLPKLIWTIVTLSESSVLVEGKDAAVLKAGHGKQYPFHFCLFCTEQFPHEASLHIPTSSGKYTLRCLNPISVRAMCLKRASCFSSEDQPNLEIIKYPRRFLNS